jgi:hypothetical protein
MLLPMAGVAAQAAVGRAVAADQVATAVRVEVAGPAVMEAAQWAAPQWAEQAPRVLPALATDQ